MSFQKKALGVPRVHRASGALLYRISYRIRKCAGLVIAIFAGDAAAQRALEPALRQYRRKGYAAELVRTQAQAKRLLRAFFAMEAA